MATRMESIDLSLLKGDFIPSRMFYDLGVGIYSQWMFIPTLAISRKLLKLIWT